MADKITNVGIVKAIFVGTTAPSNTDVIWRDTSLAIPLHKWYNPSTSSWEELINTVLIDNVTIKRDVDGKLYVETSSLPGYTIPNGSITLIKMDTVPALSIIGNATGSPATAQYILISDLKTALGISGSNTGDQDLSGFALKTYVINGHLLNGNFDITASEVGAPSGSGTSTGTNTGDETLATILTKLGITVLSGDNTGDQTAATVPIADTGNLYIAENVETALAEVKTQANTNTSDIARTSYVQKITLPAFASVANRCSNAVAGTDYPTGWTLVASGVSEVDLKITHGLDKNFITAKIWVINSDTTQRRLPDFSAAFTGLLQNSTNEIVIEGLAQNVLALRIDLEFER